MRTDHLEKNSKQITIRKLWRKRWMRAVSMLAAVTVFCTTYALILPAITINADVHCGKEEHEHTDACYASELICGLEEGQIPEGEEEIAAEPVTETTIEKVLVDAGHTHTEACYEAEQVLICENTEEDHEHDESCYEMQETLICGEEEREAVYEEKEVEVVVEATEEAKEETATGHVHTKECYKKELTCEKEEHKHGDECFADKNADLETSEIWERTLPLKSNLKEEWKEDTLAIAKSQLGYKESSLNYIVTEDGEHKGYNRYGQMFGNAYGDWCAMFLQFCMHYADVDERVMEGNPSVPLWVEEAKENKNFFELGDKIIVEEEVEVKDGEETKKEIKEVEKEFEPQPSDIIFFEWEGDESPDHVGIVDEIKKNDDDEITIIVTIEGNSQNEVRRNTYKIDDEHIFGFSRIPDKMTEEEIEEILEEREAVKQEAKEAEEAAAEEAKNANKKQYIGVD